MRLKVWIVFSASSPIKHNYWCDILADLDASGFYCRFAIRSRVDNESAFITPLGSNLLRYNERWKVPRYSGSKKPVVIDFSPSVLGLAEGFSDEGFEVAAGVGFDTVHDMTWKVGSKGVFLLIDCANIYYMHLRQDTLRQKSMMAYKKMYLNKSQTDK